MKQNWRYKVLGVILTTIVLLPYTVQALHALENHEHKVCNAKDAKHFHSQELDCSLCCTPIDLNILPSNFENYSLNSIEYLESCEKVLQLTSLDFFQLKSPRAPPVLS